MVETSLPLQRGMRTHLVENTNYGGEISKIHLGRITKVNYQTTSVGFILLTTDDGERSSADNSYSAMLPMSMAGRNSYGKAYGDVTPVTVGDIILVGFINNKAYRPIVLAIYPDEAIAGELTRANRNDIDPRSVLDYAAANSSYKMYPDQTYDFHDGKGTRAITFSGHSFILVNSDVNTSGEIEHRADDGDMPLDYKDLPSSYLGNQELVEPLSDKAPEIIFKHTGIVDSNDKPDTHALYLYIGQDGTYRVSQMKTDEDWRTYFEIKDSEIHLIRQKNSKVFGGLDVDSLNSSSINVDKDGNITLRNHTMGVVIKEDGLYTLSGERLLATTNAISDLILDKLGGLGFGGANLFSESTATKNVYLDENNNEVAMAGAIVSDYIDCIGKSAYYTYAYAEHDVLDMPVTLSLCVYDSDKKYIEGKEAKGKANVQIATRALPADASYLRVSITDGSVPIMLAYGAEYSAYQPSYLDNKANKSKVGNSTDKAKKDYLAMQALASDTLNKKTLAMQNIREAVEDGQLSTGDKQLLNSYVNEANSDYQNDINKAIMFEVNTDAYKQAYSQLLGRINPMLQDMTTAIPVSSDQITDVWDVYYSARCDLTGRMQTASEVIYNNSTSDLNSAQISQNNSMLNQFTAVTQSLQSIMQTTKWTVWTDDLDLNNETVTENILFKGEHIYNSPIKGSQYIQVYAPISERSVSAPAPASVTQRVWSTTDITSYSRVKSGDTWSHWTLDASNSDYDKQLNNISNNVENIRDVVGDLTSSTDSIKQQIQDSSLTLAQYRKTNDTRVGTVEDRVTGLENRATKLEKDVSQAKSDIIGVTNTANSNYYDIRTLTTNLNTLTTTCNTLTTTVNDLVSQISKLDSRISALENEQK